MKLQHLSYLTLLLVLSACYSVEKPDKPTNLISENIMVDVLVDMAIMSSAKGVNKRKVENIGIFPDQYIYKKHNIDSTTFAESNAYYAFDIKKYDAIYLRVKDSLTILRDKYKAIDNKEKQKKEVKDSIKRAKIKADKLKKTNQTTDENIVNEDLLEDLDLELELIPFGGED